MFIEIRSNFGIKTSKGFHVTKTNCSRRFMNERQPNLREREGCWGWQRRKTSLRWLMWPSTQSIGKDIKASSLFTRRAVVVISEAFFSAINGDRDDELAAMDLSMIASTPSWLVCILIVMPVWLYFSHHLVWFWIFFLNMKLYICCTSVSWVWFLLPYVSLQSNWAWKPLIFGLSISFCLWIFVSAHVLVT